MIVLYQSKLHKSIWENIFNSDPKFERDKSDTTIWESESKRMIVMITDMDDGSDRVAIAFSVNNYFKELYRKE